MVPTLLLTLLVLLISLLRLVIVWLVLMPGLVGLLGGLTLLLDLVVLAQLSAHLLPASSVLVLFYLPHLSSWVTSMLVHYYRREP
jgi:hypothetical protein